MNPKQFIYDHIQRSSHDCGGKHPFFFTCAMISTCKPLLDQIGTDTDPDNHVVEDLLIKEKVIRGGSTDSESCQLWVYFATRKAGEKFIDRLNAYLRKLAVKYAKQHPGGF